jgi:3-benzylmalate isomerase
MLRVLQTRRVEKLPDAVRLKGRVLFLAEDPALVRRQLEGEDLPPGSTPKLRDNISTDEITPAYICYYYDATLGDFPYLGLKCGDEFPVTRGAVKRGGFVASVSGQRRGKGSSREQSPYAELCAGIRLVVAESIERIYRENCENLGVLTTTDFSIVDKVRRGEAIPLRVFTQGEGEITRGIIEYGGLFNFNVARLQGKVTLTPPRTTRRPMTLGEKIIARHWVADPAKGAVGVPAVKPGDEGFVVTDLRFSHEYVTPMAAIFFEDLVGPDEKVYDPDSVLLFRDHLTFLGEAMTPERVKEGLLNVALELEKKQRAFAEKQGIKLYGELRLGHHGSEAICHSKILEGHAEPGMIIIGSDSHTPHAGAVGCVAFGVGTTAIFNAWITKDVRLTVPETVKVVVSGRKPDNVTAKDFMLEILRHDDQHDGGSWGVHGLRRARRENGRLPDGVPGHVAGARGAALRRSRERSGCRVLRGDRDRRGGDSADDRAPGRSRKRAPYRRSPRAGPGRHRLRRLLHGGEEGRHGHVRPGAARGGRAGRAGGTVGALLHPVWLAGREALLRGAGLPRLIPGRRRGVPRAVVRSLHQCGAGGFEDA